MQIETVRVKADIVPGNELGYIVINKTDFDVEKHQLWSDAAAAKDPAPAEPVQHELAAGPKARAARPVIQTDADKAGK